MKFTTAAIPMAIHITKVDVLLGHPVFTLTEGLLPAPGNSNSLKPTDIKHDHEIITNGKSYADSKTAIFCDGKKSVSHA